MKEKAITLQEAELLSSNKIVNPEKLSFFSGVTPDTAVLVVLAAGKGTRFGTDPKCIQPVCGVPLSKHTIDSFRRMNSAPVICLVGYKHDEVQQALGDENIYIRSANPAGGTALASWEALCIEELVEKDLLLIITMGDRIVPTSVFEQIIGTHCGQLKEPGLTFLTAQYENPRNKGRGRILRDNKGNVERIIEQKDIDTEENPTVRIALDSITECNCPLYAIRACKLKDVLSGITNDNAQQQYYLTDIVSVLKNRNEEIRTVTITTKDPEFDLLSSDVTRSADLALLEGILSTPSGLATLEYSKRLRYRVHFPQKSTFSGELGNYLFVGKGIRREGVKLADFLNPVVRPSVGRFNI